MTTLTLTLLTLGIGAAPKPEGVQYKNLLVFPLYESIGNVNPREYISLDEGLKAGTVVVKEKGGQGAAPLVRSRSVVNSRVQHRQSVGGGAEVNSLWITNNSGKKLILLAGEMVVGGQQDRILQKDGLIPPTKKAVNLDVFCVEHGRWSPTSSQFGAAKAASKPAIGGIADPSVRGRAQASRDQGQVWAEVDRSLARNKTTNGTQNYNANLQSPKVQGTVDQYTLNIERKFPLDKAVGAVVVVNGELVWMDRFANNQTFRKYWPKLIRSYALEGLSSSNEPTNRRAPVTYEEALRYAAQSGTGVTKFEGQEGVWKLLRTDDSRNVRFELQDVTGAKPISLHVSRMKKR
jgi:hypothetical protein